MITNISIDNIFGIGDVSFLGLCSFQENTMCI